MAKHQLVLVLDFGGQYNQLIARRVREEGVYCEMIPGDSSIERIRAIILSMTPKERDNPQIINYSRKKRIALGSGTTMQDINQLLKQFEQTKQLMKQMKGGKRRLPF